MTTATEEREEEARGPDVVVIRDRPRLLRNPLPALTDALARREPRSPVPEPLGVTVAVRALLVFSLLGVWVLLYAFALSGVQEGRNQGVLYAQLRQGLAEATTPFGGAIPAGTPVALVDARASGLSGVVVV